MLMNLPPRVCRVLPIAGHSHCRASRNRYQRIVRLSFPTKFPCMLRHSSPPSLADLTDADFFLESLNPSLFPGIPSGVEAHKGFASEQAKYVTPFLITAPHSNNDDEPKDRIENSLRRPNYSLDERHFVCHRCRPLSRRGTRPP